ncbi:unnamed protein product [Heligmosomoides polygyrus]|uniref:Transmembrane protein 144 n=1 Tax=Heligmosomoides polygyrus TaxID=6339 RepID=A0A183GVC3_HELPZ|nr:unnamed protein product [Heligmosomoides polygyrus]
MWNPTHPENFPGAPQESLPYLFSFFLGVLCTSVAVFALYSFVKRNTPLVSAESALPSMLAGAIFAVAMASFVVAIDQLNASIAYPICAMAPGLVVTSWSVLYFREITVSFPFSLAYRACRNITECEFKCFKPKEMVCVPVPFRNG